VVDIAAVTHILREQQQRVVEVVLHSVAWHIGDTSTAVFVPVQHAGKVVRIEPEVEAAPTVGRQKCAVTLDVVYVRRNMHEVRTFCLEHLHTRQVVDCMSVVKVLFVFRVWQVQCSLQMGHDQVFGLETASYGGKTVLGRLSSYTEENQVIFGRKSTEERRPKTG